MVFVEFINSVFIMLGVDKKYIVNRSVCVEKIPFCS